MTGFLLPVVAVPEGRPQGQGGVNAMLQMAGLSVLVLVPTTK